MAGVKALHGDRVWGVFHAKHNREQMKYERTRLDTYRRWSPSWPVKPQDLAKAGFYYLGVYDRVKCFSCGGELEGWKAEDSPKLEHLRQYPQCPFMKRLKEIEDLTDGQAKQTDIRHDEIDSHPIVENIPLMADMQQLVFILDLIPVDIKIMCKRPQYTEEKARLESFKKWPAKFEKSAPKTKWLANSGFYYTGEDDLARCFFCTGGINCWEPQDEPWYEHARSYPTCKWLIHMKGKSYIDDAQKADREKKEEGCKQTPDEGSPTTPDDTPKRENGRGVSESQYDMLSKVNRPTKTSNAVYVKGTDQDHIKLSTTTASAEKAEGRETDVSINNLMSSEIMKNVIDFGYSKAPVKQVEQLEVLADLTINDEIVQKEAIDFRRT